MDRDGDGRISFDDFAASAATQGMRADSPVLSLQRERMFDEADTDGDGFLDRSELANLLLSLGVTDGHHRAGVCLAVFRLKGAAPGLNSKLTPTLNVII